MTPHLTPAGDAQTKVKLADLEQRLAALETRKDLSPRHFAEVRRSYESMIRQYRREIKLFEATRSSQNRANEAESRTP